MLLLASVSALLALAPPDFLSGQDADSIHELFRGEAVAVSQSRLDITGDGQRERLVVVGRPGPTGVLFPIGLSVVEAIPKDKGTPRFRVIASAVLDLNPAYDARIGRPFSDADGEHSSSGVGGPPVADGEEPFPIAALGAFPDNVGDLDGDGRPELMLHTRARGPRLSEVAVTWWQLDGATLRPIYHLQRQWVTRHGTERRSVTVVAVGLIEERIETTNSAGVTSVQTARLVYDPAQRKFVAAPTASLRAPAR